MTSVQRKCSTWRLVGRDDVEHCPRPATVYTRLGVPTEPPPADFSLLDNIGCWYCRRCAYREYMNSSAWESRRNRLVKYRAFSRCERCGWAAGRGKNGQPTGLNVHHLNYDRVGSEDDKDLIVLCRSCHEAEHGLADR